MKIKNILSVLLCIGVGSFLVGCGGSDSSSDESQNNMISGTIFGLGGPIEKSVDQACLYLDGGEKIRIGSYTTILKNSCVDPTACENPFNEDDFCPISFTQLKIGHNGDYAEAFYDSNDGNTYHATIIKVWDGRLQNKVIQVGGGGGCDGNPGCNVNPNTCPNQQDTDDDKKVTIIKN